MGNKNDITLIDTASGSKVNGGTPIVMWASSIKWDANTYLGIANETAKTVNQTHSQLLAYGDSLGISNPKITLSGVINLEEYHKTSGVAPTNRINVKLLQQMWKSGHIFTLTDLYDDTRDADIYRVHSLSGTFPNETVSTISVKVESLSFSTDTQVKEGAKIMYTLGLVEVRT